MGKIKGEGPEIKSIIPQKSEDCEFLVDLELSYKGTIIFEIDTAYHIDWPKANQYKLPMTIKIQLNEFYSVIRACFVPKSYGKSWFSFIGEPVIQLDIDPIISKKYHLSKLPQVKSIMQEIINQKIRKMTFPNIEMIKIPLSKKGKKIEQIRAKLQYKKQQTTILANIQEKRIYNYQQYSL
ncbi:hypothetical protein IMG5_073520 [Ichthyophthirius multifiliis]|uniref:SMP-LTD domain-containing protein n=1 Tax=Ichthyophthirius multifiliis TaxID=5932 RepID=G0QQ03_ICHMU|nr:hypothetical protein IMG5_073520 [Ichthyophthirius multifiliis]EGR32702.1 hypothetical protein IMG5_073520 [Ichthyophthirius multifiliis]|eukprot:XP_004036688.1 hypothetical protein IMG5_073520 [Ichthyophthirius multifiliis]